MRRSISSSWLGMAVLTTMALAPATMTSAQLPGVGEEAVPPAATAPFAELLADDAGDPQGPPCGDLNDDGIVDLSDLLIVLQTFGSDDLSGDVNGSGQVNFADIVLLLVQWGGTCN